MEWNRDCPIIWLGIKREDLSRTRIGLKVNILEMADLSFRVLMVELNEQLDKKEVNSLIFLLQDYVPRMKMAKDKVTLLFVLPC